MNEYDNIMHEIADKLMGYFEGTDADNYIEQHFQCNKNPSKSFVLTMQIKSGITPCQKLAIANERITTLEGEIISLKEKQKTRPN